MRVWLGDGDFLLFCRRHAQHRQPLLAALFKHRLLPSVWNILPADDSCDGNDEVAHAIFLATVAYIEATNRFD